MTRPAVVAITVTFHPELAVLQAQIEALRGQLSEHWLVDNGSDAGCQAVIQAWLQQYPWLRWLPLGTNLGLAAAINAAVEQLAAYPASTRLLLLDQDTRWTPAALPPLLQVLAAQPGQGLAGMVGPALRDPQTGLRHGFHVIRGWQWARVQAAADAAPVAVDSLNGSGSVLALGLFRAVGGLESDLFIDHIDTEFSFRLLAHGASLQGVPAVEVEHAMGERGRRIWLCGWRVFPERSPLRHRYLYRNTLRLLRRNYVPRVWKLWAVLKLLLTAGLCLLYDPRRGAQWRAMAAGLRAGWRDARND